MNYKHGYARKGHKSVEYWTWQSICARCYRRTHISFKDYGARGIRVCARWRRSFADFLADVGPRPSARHSLERSDNMRGYYPDNVEWATRDIQNRNKRTNRMVVINKRRRPLSEWADAFDIPYGTVLNRVRRGWTVKSALKTPVLRTKKKPIGASLRQKVKVLYAAGWTKRRIADKFGLHGGPQSLGKILYGVRRVHR